MRKDKDKVRIQVQYIKPITRAGYYNMPSYFHKKSDGLSKKFSSVIKVKVDDIDTRARLVFVITKWFGVGTFNILFFNIWNRNKKYNPNFKCKMDRCPVLEIGKCNNKRFYNLWKDKGGMINGKRAKGWSCRMNPKFKPRMCKRARITIYPTYSNTDIDFKFRWHDAHDLMYRFSRWFWKGKGDKKYDNRVY